MGIAAPGLALVALVNDQPSEGDVLDRAALDEKRRARSREDHVKRAELAQHLPYRQGHLPRDSPEKVASLWWWEGRGDLPLLRAVVDADT